MKKIVSCLITVTFLFTLFSCEKDLFVSRKFVGSWKILTPDSDTITFNDKSSFIRKDNDEIDHTFKYNFDRDSITIQYDGPDMVLVKPSTHYYKLKDNDLSINFTNGCYGFAPAIYKLTRIE